MSFALMVGAKVRSIHTSIDNGFALPAVEEFEKLINANTRAILICNPNNPTGYVYTRQEMEQIRDIVKKHDLYLFADEVYREYIYTDEPYTSAMHLEGIENNVILVDSVSKRYSECGIRIGAIITKNTEVRKAVLKFCQRPVSLPPLMGQIIAEASLEAPESYIEGVQKEYVERRNCLVNGLNQIPGVFSPMPKGAFYTVAKLPVDNAEKFCRWLLEEFSYEGETVMMAPASGFYSTKGCRPRRGAPGLCALLRRAAQGSRLLGEGPGGLSRPREVSLSHSPIGSGESPKERLPAPFPLYDAGRLWVRSATHSSQ